MRKHIPLPHQDRKNDCGSLEATRPSGGSPQDNEESHDRQSPVSAFRRHLCSADRPHFVALSTKNLDSPRFRVRFAFVFRLVNTGDIKTPSQCGGSISLRTIYRAIFQQLQEVSRKSAPTQPYSPTINQGTKSGPKIHYTYRCVSFCVDCVDWSICFAGRADPRRCYK